MTDTQKDELKKKIVIFWAKHNKSVDQNEWEPDLDRLINEHFEQVEAKIEEAEKRGGENISIGVLQRIENLYKLWSPEPIFPSSPIYQFIRELQDLVLKSNLADK